MNFTFDKQHLPNAMILGGAIVLFTIILAIYLDARDSLITQRNANDKNLVDGQTTLERASRIRKLLSGGTFNSDTSAAEGQLLDQLHNWEQQSGVTNASFQRFSAQQEHGFTCLTFQISAEGPMPAVAGLLFKVETAPIPLRVESVDVRPLNDAGDQLNIVMNVSVPCRAAKGNEPQVTAGNQPPGGNG